VQALTAAGVSVMSYDALAAAGAAKPVGAVAPKPDDYCTIMYTSGTTGALAAAACGVLLKCTGSGTC
jgi:long-chain acyl-CoA synthetase